MLLRNLFESIARTGQGKTAVVGWGRGMGHKGHMMLASSVITKAKAVGGDPYFVVSRTVGKDDPLTADEKLAIYKKVFPEQGHIFQAASDAIPDLTRVLTNLNQQGYTDAVVVVGADQVKAFQYLKNYNGKPDKSGNVAFNFNSLDVISRQETGDPSAGEEGPRATPMRNVLTDPNASPEQQFQTWRDAMSPELSDDEVRDLMAKSKDRMAQFSAPKAKKVAAKEEAGVGVIASKKQAKDPRYSMSLTKDVRPGQVEKGLKAFNLAELSNDTLARYKTAAAADAKKADAEGDYARGNKRFSGIVKATKKQFDNDMKEAGNPAQQAAIAIAMKKAGKKPKSESQSTAIAHTAKSLENPPKVMQHRAKRDQERDAKWMSTQIAKNDRTSKDEWGNLKEKKQRLDPSCWKGYRKAGTKMKGGVRVNNCVKVSEGVEDIMDALINQIVVNEAKQGKLHKSHSDASPGMHRYPEVDNPYRKYRLGVMAAGAPDHLHDYATDGPAVDDMITAHYSDADEEIMRSARTKMGYKATKIASKGSTETEVNNVSPVANWNKK